MKSASQLHAPGVLRRLAWLGLAAGLLALAGCAAPVGTSAAGADPITESDESPARKRARIRTELAVGYFEEGRTEVALDEVKQALGNDSLYAPAYNLRGLIYLRLNDPRQAEDSFRRALALNPRDPDTLHNYAWMACAQGRHDEAERAFGQALVSPVYPARARTYLAQGVCQARAGRLTQAQDSLTRAYDLDATNPLTGYNLAQLLYRQGELSRARLYIRRLNNSESANAESLWLGIRVERRLSDPIAMQQLVDQLRKRYPQSRELVAYDKGIFDE
jgi:type IV pilus assembly protein PilF